jgi:hypothetical protein
MDSLLQIVVDLRYHYGWDWKWSEKGKKAQWR